MATTSFSTPISHTSDANFRIWGLEFSNACTTVGFIKSADTGQINWASVTRAGINTIAGYEIRYLNDSLHGSAPVYVKLEFGTGALSDTPEIWFTVGTGTNGSGTITGEVVSRRVITHTQFAVTSTATNHPSYFCKTEGAVWFSWKIGSRTVGGVGGATLAIFRSCDAFGEPTATSVVCYMNPAIDNGGLGYSANTVCYTFATGYTASIGNASAYGGGSGGYTFFPYGLSSGLTTVAGVPPTFQASRHFIITPQVYPIAGILSSTPSDGVSLGSTFEATAIGSTPHTYISLETNLSAYEHCCLIWE